MLKVHQDWTEAVNRHDPDAVASLYAPNAVSRDPAYARPLEGADAIRTDMSNFLRAFPDLRVEVNTTIETDSSYAVEATFTGTHEGPLPTDAGEVPPSGREIEMRAAGFYRLDGQGRILEESRYYDLNALLSQLWTSV
jgi:steroid delta-isomerase-like uncharacterized protein